MLSFTMTTPTETAAELDVMLCEALEEDLLALLLTPPRAPSFAAETVRPGKLS